MEDKRNIYSQLYSILQCISIKDFKKIPENVWNRIKEGRLEGYKFKFDSSKDLKDQNVLKETKILYDKIYERYISN